MAQNRYLPFGYRIANGAITAQPEEADTVRGVYRRYAEGASYKAIAAELTSTGIPYMPDKSVWNKNMVARILQNENYLGTKKYPAVIELDDREAAFKAQKQYTLTEPPEIKQLKGLFVCAVCGEPVKRRLKSKREERWFCPADPHHIGISVTDDTLLENVQAQQNRMVSSPAVIAGGTSGSERLSFHIAKLQNELELMMKQEPPDADGIRERILSLTAEKYALCDEDAEAEQAILSLLKNADPLQELDMQLICKITRHITVGPCGELTLVLKNGKSHTEGELRHA